MFNRKAIAGIVSIAALMAAMPAMAQSASSTSGASSNSGAVSGSQSGAVSSSRGGAGGTGGTASNNTSQGVNTGATVNQTYNTSGNQGVNYTGGTNSYETSRQTGDVTIRTTPQVYAPPVSGGNPCTLAVSGGVSVIGWGAAAGGTFVDQDCAMRQKIAMVHNAGYAGVAFEMMCNDRDTYNAAKTAGKPCAVRPQFEAPGVAPQPMVQQAPTPVVTPPPAPVVAKVYPRCNPARGIVDNCTS